MANWTNLVADCVKNLASFAPVGRLVPNVILLRRNRIFLNQCVTSNVFLDIHQLTTSARDVNHHVRLVLMGEELSARAVIIPIISSTSTVIDALRSAPSILLNYTILMNAWDARTDALNAMIKTTPSAKNAPRDWRCTRTSVTRSALLITSKARMGLCARREPFP